MKNENNSDLVRLKHKNTNETLMVLIDHNFHLSDNEQTVFHIFVALLYKQPIILTRLFH